MDVINVPVEVAVFQQNSQRKMASGHGGQVLLHLERVNFVDHVSDQHHQRSLQAVRPKVKEGLIVSRLDECRLLIVGRVQQAVYMIDAGAGGREITNSIVEANHSNRIALPQRDVAEHQHGV